jgi:hypothetical protein
VLDQRGVADRFLAEGTPMQVQAFAGVPLDISDFPTRHHYGLALLQSHVERIMAGWIEELGVPILREREVRGFTQDDDGVDVTISDGSCCRAVPGRVRRGPQHRAQRPTSTAGWGATTCWIHAEVEWRRSEFRLRGGGIGPAGGGGSV